MTSSALVHPVFVYLSWLTYAGSGLILVLVFKNALAQYVMQLVRPLPGDTLVWEDHSEHRRQGLLIALLLSGVAWLILSLPFLWILALFAGLALALPKILILRAHKALLEAFDDSLVDGLVSLSSSLRAGLTIQAALQVASKSTAPAFARQADKVLLDYRLGVHIDEAMARVRSRIPTQSCNMAVGALIIGKQLGGPLPDILERIAATLRERQRVEGRLRAITAQGRGQGVLICTLPLLVAAGTAWLTPERMDLMVHSLAGQVMLAAVCICEVVGIFLAWKILQLDI